MLREIPEYCEQFQCIADRCPDTCCRGWEVDIDPYTEEYYEEIPGEFGELLRDEMKVTDDGALFLPDQNGRCPFLNQCNLCEIILHLGEDAISQVCTEYPRYYHQIGDYEQVDMSLSCMELGRLFFSEEGPVRYALYEDDEPGDEIDDETYNRLMQLLDERSSLLETITELCTEQGTDYLKVRSILSEFPTSSLSLSDTRNDLDPAQDLLLMKRLSETELLDHRWEEQFRNIQKYLADRESTLTQISSQAADTCSASDLSASKFSDPKLSDPKLSDPKFSDPELSGPKLSDSELSAPELSELLSSVPEAGLWFTRLSMYFIFRYYADAVDEPLDCEKRLIQRSLRTAELLVLTRFHANGGTFTVDEMIDLIHLYSKQIEHSTENVDLMKAE